MMSGNKLSHEETLLVMALADGELSGSDLDRARTLVAHDPEARALWEEFSRNVVGRWVGEAMERPMHGAGAVADNVMALVDLEPSQSRVDRTSTVVDLSKRQASRAGRGAIAAVTVTMMAAAAGAFVMLRSTPEPQPIAKTTPTVLAPSPTLTPSMVEPEDVALSLSGSGSPYAIDVEEVDSEEADVSIIYVPGSEELASVVIWVGGEPELEP